MFLSLAVILSFVMVCPVSAQNIARPASKNISMTVYNNDLALIKDVRPLQLTAGENLVAFEGIASAIQPASVMILGADIRVLEQNYDDALLTPFNIISKKVGQNIKTVRVNPQTGENIFAPAKLVAFQGGQPILQFDYGIETNFDGRLVFDDLPQRLNQKPTLTAKISSLKAGLSDITLAYLSRGLAWSTNYVADIKDDKVLDLTGWVSITNQSGASYDDVSIQLIAGDINKVRSPMMVSRKMVMANAMSAGIAEDMAYESSSVEPETFSAYQLYTLPYRTTLEDNQTKQMALIEAKDVSYEKEGRLSSPLYFSSTHAAHFEKAHPEIFYIIKNETTSNLGLPLPTGVMRFYQTDSKNNLQFIGENRIGQTPKDETLELNIGKMFDVTVDGKVTNIAKLSENVITTKSDRCPRYKIVRAYDVTVNAKNTSDKNTILVFKQHLSPDMKIAKQNIEGSYDAKDGNMYQWRLNLENQNSQTLTFTVEATFEEVNCH